MILIEFGSGGERAEGEPWLLFVYGTLRRRSRHPMARLLALHARFLGGGRISGRLYRVGVYPAAVEARRCGEIIHGDLYDVRGSPGLIERLDRYEGVGRGRRGVGEYRRVVVQAELDAGGRHSVWVYLYNGRIAGLPRLISGDFIAQRRRATVA